MFIKAENVFKTHKARNEAYKSFMDDLDKAGSYKQISKLKGRHIDLFSKLRTEKDMGYDWVYPYLEEIEEAIADRKALLTLHQKRKADYVR